MRKEVFALVFVLLVGVLFYSEPLTAAEVDGSYIVNEIIRDESCDSLSGFEEASQFTDGQDITRYHCVDLEEHRKEDNYVLNSFLTTENTCSVGKSSGQFWGADNEIVTLCVVKEPTNNENELVRGVSIGSSCQSSFRETEDVIDIGDSGIIHCILGGDEDAGSEPEEERNARVADCSSLSNNENTCENTIGCRPVYDEPLFSPILIGCSHPAIQGGNSGGNSGSSNSGGGSTTGNFLRCEEHPCAREGNFVEILERLETFGDTTVLLAYNLKDDEFYYYLLDKGENEWANQNYLFPDEGYILDNPSLNEYSLQVSGSRHNFKARADTQGCTILIDTEEPATNTDFEFGDVFVSPSGFFDSNDDSVIKKYSIIRGDGVSKSKMIAIKDVMIRDSWAVSSFDVKSDSNFDTTFDKDTWILTPKSLDQDDITGQISAYYTKPETALLSIGPKEGFSSIGTYYWTTEREGTIWIVSRGL
jgi:hypothetical protein